MRASAFKWVIFSATLLLAALVAFQLFWLKRIYNTEQQLFTTNVMRSVRGLMEDLPLTGAPVRLQQVVQRPGRSTFLVSVDSIPPRDSLATYLAQELEDFDVLTDCQAGMYNKRKGRFDYALYLPSAGSAFASIADTTLPVLDRSRTHLLLYFPHHDKYLMHEMRFWITGTIFLLLLLIGLVISLFYLYRQKFLNELQKDFVNNFTHEFKTPLAVMKIASDVLMDPRTRTQGERLMKYSGIIEEQTRHLQRQVDRLLRAAQSRSAIMDLEKQPVNPNELVRQALQQLEPLVREKNAEVHLALDERDAKVNADAEHLQLVIVNLVENALKYSREPRIRITTARVNGHYSISVKDNGIGIEKKYMGRLFHKFYRVPTGDVHNVKGFGLGLDFVKKVVQAHHGKVQVRSIPGVGSEFEIILPA
jgi:two-component system, OmpR family, phosphate regulon sensor histidine kinase PhoR